MAETPENLYALINKTGSVMKTAAGATATASTPVFLDSASVLTAAGFPFAVPMIAGVTSTSASVMTIEGSTTGAAATSMIQTLAQGASGSLTTAGFIRITITDDAGNLTNGQYYIPFGTLS